MTACGVIEACAAALPTSVTTAAAFDAFLLTTVIVLVGATTENPSFEVNAALLSLYTFSCHSCRHLCGGGLNVFSKAPARHGIWRVVSRLNEKHMQIAWVSLIWVGLTDVYIRLLSMGVIKDVRFF